MNYGKALSSRRWAELRPRCHLHSDRRRRAGDGCHEAKGGRRDRVLGDGEYHLRARRLAGQAVARSTTSSPSFPTFRFWRPMKQSRRSRSCSPVSAVRWPGGLDFCLANRTACVLMTWKIYPESKPAEGSVEQKLERGLKMTTTWDGWTDLEIGEQARRVHRIALAGSERFPAAGRSDRQADSGVAHVHHRTSRSDQRL